MNKDIDISRDCINLDENFMLRFWKQDDLLDLHEMAKIEGVGENLGWKHSEKLEETEKLLQKYLDGKCNFAIVDKKKEKVIGSLGLEKYTPSEHKEIFTTYGRELYGYISPEYWGKKIMSKAVKAVIKHGFSSCGLDFIVAGHFDTNKKSKKIIEKMGFEYANTIQFKTGYGAVVPTDLYILKKENYKKI